MVWCPSIKSQGSINKAGSIKLTFGTETTLGYKQCVGRVFPKLRVLPSVSLSPAVNLADLLTEYNLKWSKSWKAKNNYTLGVIVLVCDFAGSCWTAAAPRLTSAGFGDLILHTHKKEWNWEFRLTT